MLGQGLARPVPVWEDVAPRCRIAPLARPSNPGSHSDLATLKGRCDGATSGRPSFLPAGLACGLVANGGESGRTAVREEPVDLRSAPRVGG